MAASPGEILRRMVTGIPADLVCLMDLGSTLEGAHIAPLAALVEQIVNAPGGNVARLAGYRDKEQTNIRKHRDWLTKRLTLQALETNNMVGDA
jgi:hypothetical protein